MRTSNDITPGPFSEQDLRQRWNDQADQFNQWDSLESWEQLAWAQTQAVATDRAENQRRLYRLQQENNRFREPERTILCDLLANGQLLPDPYGKRYRLKVDPTRAALKRLIEAIEGIELKGVPEVDDAIAATRAALANAEPAPIGKHPLQVAPPAGEEAAELVEWLAMVRDRSAGLASNRYDNNLSRIIALLQQRYLPPTPPADGEVAQLVELLKLDAKNARNTGALIAAATLTRTVELLKQRHPAPVALSEREAGAIEALRRLRRWGKLSGGGYSADVVLGVVDWIDGGMTGPLPPLPAWVRTLPMPAGETQP